MAVGGNGVPEEVKGRGDNDDSTASWFIGVTCWWDVPVNNEVPAANFSLWLGQWELHRYGQMFTFGINVN